MEQRKARRFDLRLPVQLLRSGSRAITDQGETRNMSSAGVLFQSKASLRIGEAVEFLVTLPTPASPTEPVRIRCMGKVVRFARKAEVATTVDRYEFVR